MKFKTIVFFVLGLLGWLIATNYQTVYSKMTNFINPPTETIVASASQNESSHVQDLEIISSNSDEQSSSDVIDSTEAESDQFVQDIEVESSETENLASESNKETHDSEQSDTTTEQIEPKEENLLASVDKAVNENSKPIATTQPPAMPQIPMGYPMMNPNMMNPAMYMNPMAMMMPMMMNMMGSMMNPNIYMNPMTMMNHPITTMTQTQNMNAMMKSMDPNMMFGMFGQPSEAYKNGEIPEQLPVITIPGMPTQNFENWPKNTVSPNISREAKQNAFQSAMAMSPLSMRNMVSMMADKIPVDEGVSWDDAVESMKLRANEVNFKFVGSSPLWKQIEAETEQPSAKVEMFRFCDARMARKILDEVPEFIVFLPCKIALLEDSEGKLWVMTLDWDVSWLDYAQNPNNHLSKDIREHAKLIRDNIQYIMEGAATGDF